MTDPAQADVTADGVLLLVEDDPDHAFLVRRALGSSFHGLPLVHLTTAAAAAGSALRTMAAA